MSVIYTSSCGKKFDFTASMSMRVKEANFHNFSWKSDVTAKRFGERVDSWQKDAAKYTASILFRGSKLFRMTQLDAFHTEIERDMFYNTAGTLLIDGWYIPCFIQSSSTYPADENDTETYNDVEIYCPSPLWIAEQSITVYPIEETTPLESDKQYNLSYGYNYSYQVVQGTSKAIYIDHYAPCDFRAVLYGPQDNVNVTIGNVSLLVAHEIPTGGYMVIDTRESVDADKHCYLYAGGTETNCFNDRNPETPLLEKVEPGTVVVTFNRQSQLDLTIYRERSEPTWN